MEKLNLIDELITEAGGDEAEAEFTFPTSTGRVFRAKRIRSAAALSKVLARAKKLKDRTKSNTPETWHPYLPITEETARGVAFLEASLIEPKLSTLDCLKLADKAGAYFMEISGHVMADAFNAQAQRDTEAVDDFLDELNGTDSEGTS